MSPLRVVRREAVVRCPVCHDGLGDDAVPCPRCGTPHHRACADDLLRCSVLGCGGALVDLDGAVERLREDVRARAARFAARRSTVVDRPGGEWARFQRSNAVAALFLVSFAWLSAATIVAVLVAAWLDR